MKIDELLSQRDDGPLSDMLYHEFDMELFSELFPPENEDGHLTYSIPGMAFAAVADGSQYILLEDGSVGFWGSEGKCGRMADSLEEFLELIVNCPYWEDVVNFSRWHDVDFSDQKSVREYLHWLEEKHNLASEREPGLSAAKETVSERLGIPLHEDISALVMKFYSWAGRAPV